MSEEQRIQWISQGDIEGRLRLLRYGLVVVVIVVFLISWLVPYAFLYPYTAELIKVAEEAHATNPDLPIPDQVDLLDSLTTRVPVPIFGEVAGPPFITVVAAVLSVIVYYAYREALKRTVGGGAGTR